MTRKGRYRAIRMTCAIMLLFVVAWLLLAYRSMSRNAMNSALLDAIERRDVTYALRLIDRGVDPNARVSHRPFLTALLDKMVGEDESTTVLWQAVDNNEPSVVQALLAHGAKGANDWDLIISACSRKDNGATSPDIIRSLVHYGADVNATDKDENRLPLHGSALMHATEIDQIEIVRFLLANKADVNAKTREGVSALSIAEIGHNEAIIRLLKQHGANE